jgi:phosphatidylinositol glycan class W
VTEYGVHWNFFITLALLPLLSVLFHPLVVHVPLSLMGLLVTLGIFSMDALRTVYLFLIVHQIVLSNTPLQDWALGNNRTTIVDQNKEGIVSFTGMR